MQRTNALAELAKRLKNGYVSLVVNDRQVATFTTAAFPELDKAQRIIAELVKIDGIKEYIYAGNTVFANAEFVDVFKRCRAIAEEGLRK